jgi:hypothetical protein
VSAADWYLALFSIGVGVSLPAYWTFVERTDLFHLVAEVGTGAVLLAAGLSMLIGNDEATWVRALSAVGLGMLVYALIDSPGRCVGDRRKQSLFVVGWLFAIPAIVLRFTS